MNNYFAGKHLLKWPQCCWVPGACKVDGLVAAWSDIHDRVSRKYVCDRYVNDFVKTILPQVKAIKSNIDVDIFVFLS